MACMYPCIEGQKINLRLGVPRISPSGSVGINQTVNITIDVTDQSLLYGGSVTVDVVDMDNGNCLYNDYFFLSKGTTKVVSFQAIMLDKDYKLRVSASSWIVPIIAPFIAYWRCEDVREFSIKLAYTRYNCAQNVCIGPLREGTYDSRDACIADGCAPPPPPLVRYTCISNMCKSLVDGEFGSLKECTDSGCKAPPGGGGVKCASDQFDIFGSCQKKTDIYMAAGAVVLLLVLMKK